MWLQRISKIIFLYRHKIIPQDTIQNVLSELMCIWSYDLVFSVLRVNLDSFFKYIFDDVSSLKQKSKEKVKIKTNEYQEYQGTCLVGVTRIVNFTFYYYKIFDPVKLERFFF